MLRTFSALVLMAASLPCLAIECLAPAPDAIPVLVIEQMNIAIDGVDGDTIGQALRERLNKDARFRVVLPDQYRYATQNNRIDKCTPAFGMELQIGVRRSDPGAAWGFSGLVTRFEFEAKADVDLLPSNVSLDTFTVKEKADSVVGGKKVEQAFDRLIENVAQEIEKRRDGWMSNNVPGF